MQPEDLSAAQRQHWEELYRDNPRMYGLEPSGSGIYAAEVFASAGVQRILELGAGHGRDSLHFAGEGFDVVATDFSAEGIEQLTDTAGALGVGHRLSAQLQDVRQPLPYPDQTFDAAYAHLLLSMALSTTDIQEAVAEVHRVLKPGGRFIYTVRHTGDPEFGEGIDVGDNLWVNQQFAVHFFDEELVETLAEGWQLVNREELADSEVPDTLWRITQSR
ncbi:class I SAM-dependent methyltransferase [Nesterenkonia sp. MY13]|uniref:Class I SAM-dependent methyltransferase n=1 Tax=Nesterenkonia sedimenti TaxID=1463632 RepID=A0A7X8TLU1_9MICC|nr:class I SAM-dependent methyltransferase [Nesterenkonia sedimenti]NLS10757.1 class I SAM-dependent methyltransferase [Nesterenkonia sedimenti]